MITINIYTDWLWGIMELWGLRHIKYVSYIKYIYKFMTKNIKKKKTPVQKKGTLDQQHTEKLKFFEKRIDSLPKKKKKLIILEKELIELTAAAPNKCTHDDIHRKAYVLDTIEKLRQDIYSIENCTESLNYIVDVLPILIDYYDNDEIIDDGMEEEILNSNSGVKKNILTYFAIEASAQEKKLNMTIKNQTAATIKQSAKEKRNKSGSKTLKRQPANKSIPVAIQIVSNPKQKISRAKLYENYLCATDSAYRMPKKPSNNKCSDPDCPGQKILCQNDGCIACTVCGMSETTLTTMEKPNYKDLSQDSGTYAYKRINHLTEILSQLQAKESTDIPPKIFDSILREIKKRKIDKNDLDIFRLRRILKKLSLIKYYEHVPHILQIINGKKPPNFSRKDELKIKKMFKDIQKPFAIYCPKNRKNFLNYSYVLHKFCELLDLDEYITYFPLLKNNSKLLQHDKIWKNICAYMFWKYYPSI